MVQCLSPFDAQDEIIVGLVQMNNLQSMDFWHAFVFLKQCVNDMLPFCIGVSTFECIVQENEVAFEDAVSYVSEFVGFIAVVGECVVSPVGFQVSQVHVGCG